MKTDTTQHMLDRPVTGKKAWVRKDIRREDWLLELPQQCIAELRAILPVLRSDQLIEAIDANRFELPACRAFMRRVKTVLDDGVRFAVIDRLPMHELTEYEANALYWILSCFIARPVQQKLNGAMTYKVHDTGQKATAGSGVRPDQTNMDQYFHNDNSYNTTPPEYVALLCVRPAKSGGVSHVTSFYTVNNELLRAHRHVLPRLYRPFWYDRQKEYAPAEPDVIHEPIFSFDGERLRARLGLFQIRSGYTMKNQPIDPEGAAAIEALQKTFADASLQTDFLMEPGHLQFVNNREIGHRRTQFEDFDDPEQKRLLQRLWLRDAGSVRYQG